MNPLDLVGLTPLMELATGRPEILIGLIDGPVALDHPSLADGNIREIPGALVDAPRDVARAVGRHGTFVMGILAGKRGAANPAICPGCTVLVRSIFGDTTPHDGTSLSTTPAELAAAIVACVDRGSHVINLSVGLANPSSFDDDALRQALDYGRRRGTIVVAAAGNQGTLGSSPITRHPGVIPVVAYDRKGKPLNQSNLGASIGRHGVGAPGDAITSLGTPNEPQTMTGTSAATPFVTGTIALLWSEFPSATAAELRFALIQADRPRRTSVTPPLLNAWAAYQVVKVMQSRKGRR